jgi:hypothetical protein
MSKLYWLGPENLRWKMGEPPLRADDEMPGKVLEALGKDRVKALKEAGKIGDAPKSAAIIRVQRNTQNALKVCQKEKADALKKLEKALAQIEKFEEKLDDFNKIKKERDAAETLNIKLEKASGKRDDNLKKKIAGDTPSQSIEAQKELEVLKKLEKELDEEKTLNIKLKKAFSAAEKVEEKLKKRIESLKAKLKKKGRERWLKKKK